MRLVAVAVAVLSLTACVHRDERVPPLGAAQRVDQLVGIWRNVRGATLELRQNGTFVLVSGPTRAAPGRWDLSSSTISFRDTPLCGDAVGAYRADIAFKHRLVLRGDDACGARRLVLTSDAWAYAASQG
jgi:hypothetical protein